MTIKAEIVADSMAENGIRLTTFLLTYPRFIHAELMTHRVFSRNASSSRAIPIKTIVKNIRADMARPLTFLKNKSGMQGGEPLGFWGQWMAELLWYGLGHIACLVALLMVKLNIHKQYGNRILEPWSHITVVLTSTEWANWFALRNHSDAQPEIKRLAEEMLYCMKTNRPRAVFDGSWHLPFISEEDRYDQRDIWMKNAIPLYEGYWLPLIKKSVARCARTSYLNHDKTQSTQAADEALHDRLLASQPLHASPAEHQATPMGKTFQNGNLKGWEQYRKKLPNENVTEYNYAYDPAYDKGVQVSILDKAFDGLVRVKE